MYTIVNCRIAAQRRLATDCWISVSGGRIHAVGTMDEGAPSEGRVYDARGGIVVPGFIDVHIHGCGGYPFDSGDEEDVRGASLTLAQRGVTAFLATLPALPQRRTLPALQAIRKVMNDPEPDGARVLGVHLEGPFISPQRAGAQDPSAIRPISLSEAREWLQYDSRLVRMMTFAPELEGASELIRLLSRCGVVPSVGHTAASYEQTLAAIDAGAWCCAHTFNGMRPFHHRDPGPVAAVLARRHVHCEFIADGVHNHAGALELLVRAKGCDRILLVSDAISLAASSQTKGSVGGTNVTVHEGAAYLGDGTLAGSVRCLDHGLRFAAETLEDEGLPKVLRMLSANQARVLGHGDELGGLEPGMAADLVVLDHDLCVSHVVLRGRPLGSGGLHQGSSEGRTK